VSAVGGAVEQLIIGSVLQHGEHRRTVVWRLAFEKLFQIVSS
jgi:hypothetical protein